MRYYNLMRPITPGTFPSGCKITDIVNFDNREFVPEINMKAWGYFDMEGELSFSDMRNYDLVPLEDKFKYKPEVGDIVVCKGIKAEIAKIGFMDYYSRERVWDPISEVICEFWDTKGNYRSYKSDLDGGYIIYKDRKPKNQYHVEAYSLKLEGKTLGYRMKVLKGTDTIFCIVDFQKSIVKDCLAFFKSIGVSVEKKGSIDGYVSNNMFLTDEEEGVVQIDSVMDLKNMWGIM